LQVAADKMVEDLRAAFKELVTESDWMDAATQVSSLDFRWS
jgi:predicted metalloendopeptidase